MVCLAGISFYLSFVEHPAYASVGIWQLFAVLMWAMFHGVINMQKDSRKLWKQLDDLKDDHIKDLYKMIEARDQEIINLKTGN